MKKILIYGLTSRLGGIENFIYNHVMNMDVSDLEISFLVYEDPIYYEELKNKGFKFIFIPRRGVDYKRNLKETRDLFKENKYDALWFNVGTLSYIYPLICAKEANVPVRIVHTHTPKAMGGWKMRVFHEFNKRRIKKYPTHFFTCSKEAGEFSYNGDIINSYQYKVIENAIDLSRFSYKKGLKEKIKNELNIKEGKIIGHVGHFLPVKNHEFIIDLFKKVVDVNDDYHLILIGQGPLLEGIKDKVQRLGLSNKVSFLGRRRDIDELLSSMDLFLFPSHFEGISLSLVEAQASGLKCLTSTNVNRLSDLTGLVKFLNLEKIEDWKMEILNIKDYERRDYREALIRAGFDIKENSKNIKKILQGEEY